jgi:ferredoxin
MISFIVPTKKISRHPNVPSSRIIEGRTLLSSSSDENSSELQIPNDSSKKKKDVNNKDSSEMTTTPTTTTSLPTSIISEDDSSTLISTTTTTSTTPTSTSAATTTTTTFLQVSYENQFCHIPIIPKETILSALEKHSDKLRLLGLPELPSECRRGNCMTCAGKLVRRKEEEQQQMTNPKEEETNPSFEFLNRSENGLSPHISQWLESSEYILTCSTIWNVNDFTFQDDDNVDEGLIVTTTTTTSPTHDDPNLDMWYLELGVNSQIWDQVYHQRFVTEDAQQLILETRAKSKRLDAERNISQWTSAMEDLYQRNSAENDIHNVTLE